MFLSQMLIKALESFRTLSNSFLLNVSLRVCYDPTLSYCEEVILEGLGDMKKLVHIPDFLLTNFDRKFNEYFNKIYNEEYKIHFTAGIFHYNYVEVFKAVDVLKISPITLSHHC